MDSSLGYDQATPGDHKGMSVIGIGDKTDTDPPGVNHPSITDAKAVAVIGMGCRFSGDATNPQKFWDMLCKGQDGWSEGNVSRFTTKSFFHPAPEMSGTV
jgi:Beta-ketoacyl synthase, N-terminal domain